MCCHMFLQGLLRRVATATSRWVWQSLQSIKILKHVSFVVVKMRLMNVKLCMWKFYMSVVAQGYCYKTEHFTSKLMFTSTVTSPNCKRKYVSISTGEMCHHKFLPQVYLCLVCWHRDWHRDKLLRMCFVANCIHTCTETPPVLYVKYSW